MSYGEEVHYDLYNLVLVDVGPNFAKILLEVKLLTGKSTREVGALLKSDRPVILQGPKRELVVDSVKLEKLGAELEYELVR